MGKKRKKGEERRGEIFEASLEILHQKGHSGLTVRNIADKIGVTEPAVYRHFESKEEIVRKLAEKVLEEDMITVDKKHYDTSFELIQEILSNLFNRLENQPLVTTILFQGDLFSEYPEVKNIFVRHQRKNKKRLKRLIEEEQENELISEDVDSETFSLILMGSVRAAVLEWRNDNFSHSLSDEASGIARELEKILKKGD